nr:MULTISPECIES: DUF5953 family protein [Myxococcaceae]
MRIEFQVAPLGGAPASSVLRLLEALERALAPVRLAWRGEVAGAFEATDDPRWRRAFQLVEVPDREAWVGAQLQARRTVLLYGGPELPGLSVTAQPALDVQLASGESVGTVIVAFTPGSVAMQAVPALVEAMGDALSAWTCALTPPASAVLALQVQRAPPGPVRPGVQALLAKSPRLAELPRLRGTARLSCAVAPPSIGWLNYWSDATAQWLGFPDPARDAEWLARAHRTPAGAWLLQLTEAPLDLERPEHLDLLIRAYRRFERIGA